MSTRARWLPLDMEKALSEPVEALCSRICEQFGYKQTRHWQAKALEALLGGHDIVISSGTGSGKSLVFQGMALAKEDAIVLVISPLISIMEDQATPAGKFH